MSVETDANAYRGRPVLFLLGILSVWAVTRGSIVMWNNDAVANESAQAFVGQRSSWSPPRMDTPKHIKQTLLGYGDDQTSVWKVSQTARPNTDFLAEIRPRDRPHMKNLGRAKEAAPSTSLMTISEPASPQQSPPPPVFVSAEPMGFARSSFEPKRSSRWSGSAWSLWRPGERPDVNGGANLPLYGGSQVGARLQYRLDKKGATALYLRASSPLVARVGKEVAVGVAIRPLKGVNAAVAVEQRIRIDGAGPRTAPTILVYGGFGPQAIAGLEFEGYAQGGVVGFKERIAFADGALTARKSVVTIGKTPVHLVAGVWGGAQKGASRLDIGPRVSADIPVTDKTVRVAFDWRQHVAGDAKPGSGIALTVGMDF